MSHVGEVHHPQTYISISTVLHEVTRQIEDASFLGAMALISVESNDGLRVSQTGAALAQSSGLLVTKVLLAILSASSVVDCINQIALYSVSASVMSQCFEWIDRWISVQILQSSRPGD